MCRLCSGCQTYVPSRLLPVGTSSLLFHTRLANSQAQHFSALYHYQVYHTLRITVQAEKKKDTTFLPGFTLVTADDARVSRVFQLSWRKNKYIKIKGKIPLGSKADYSKVPLTGRAAKCARYSERTENPMHRGAWRARVHGVARSRPRVSG